mmetsp:Transcript_85139/g.165042  ORF Transcript_85139/g.165042 Transcript_85139/m.165042 type:complete len:82 (+) Transcript_85139:152-397(+)
MRRGGGGSGCGNEKGSIHPKCFVCGASGGGGGNGGNDPLEMLVVKIGVKSVHAQSRGAVAAGKQTQPRIPGYLRNNNDSPD